jgi:hypothetical protein
MEAVTGRYWLIGMTIPFSAALCHRRILPRKQK